CEPRPAREDARRTDSINPCKIAGNEKPQVFNPLSFKLATFPMLLQRAGYETAYIGKWQAVRTARWKYAHYTELEGRMSFTTRRPVRAR
ncbi:MAG: hypothetical protein ACREEM_23460, partial [Blastocatellia bacterium]